ncbi:MAG: hypothetical protein WAK08_20740, partial [Pseudolabrys sp.]
MSKRCLKIVKISSAIGGDFGNKCLFAQICATQQSGAVMPPILSSDQSNHVGFTQQPCSLARSRG